MSSISNMDEAKRKLEIKKIQLENKKLEKELNKPWYQKLFINVNIIQLLTVVIVISGAIAAYYTNYFQNQNTLLEIRKATLNKDVEALNSEIKKLKKDSSQLKRKNAGLVVEKNRLTTRLFELNDTIALMLHTDEFIRKSAKKRMEFSMEYIGNNVDTTKLTAKELNIIRDEIYLTYLRIGSFEKQSSRDGNRIQEFAEKYIKCQKENDSLIKFITQYKPKKFTN